MTRQFATVAVLALAAGLLAADRDAGEFRGLVTPGDEGSFCILNADGRTPVRWADDTKVVLSVNWRQLGSVQGAIRHAIYCLPQTVEYKLPTDTWYARKTIRPREVEDALKAASEKKEINAFGLAIQAKPLADHLPTKAEPYFAGRFRFAGGRGKPATLTVGDKAFEVRMRRGQTTVPIHGLVTRADCKPYVTRARVTGRKVGEVIVAEQVSITPVGDQAAADDPKLPRMLVIGDSISLNYLGPLRKALAGKVNVHHPPTNCGRSATGAQSAAVWVGDYQAKGRRWDVISFNFGHWDSGNTKQAYQKSLETVIASLKKTKAKLIWVTTCPVPNGNEKAGELSAAGKAPGRKSGVMAKYLNPWAAEVMRKHPEITVCDQWQFVKDHGSDLYKDWWTGDNVHFGGKQADELGKLLASHAMKVLGK